MTEAPRPRRRTWLRAAARATALAFPAAFAPHLPVAHWLVDVPASFAVQAGAALLVGAGLWLLAGCRRSALVWLTGAAAALIAVLPGWLAVPRLAAAGGQPLALLALNLERGNEANAAAALAAIARHRPDVVFTSELTPAWLERLAPGLAAYPHRVVQADPGWFGVGLWSRLPLAEARPIPLGFTWAPAVRAVVDTARGPVGVLGVHLPRPGTGDRCAERDAALAAIPRAVAALPARRVVIGDFNATPWNRAFPAMLAASALHNASGRAFRPTWPTSWPWPLRVPIDHLLVDAGTDVERVEVGAPFGSDHAPLFAVIRIR